MYIPCGTPPGLASALGLSSNVTSSSHWSAAPCEVAQGWHKPGTMGFVGPATLCVKSLKNKPKRARLQEVCVRLGLQSIAGRYGVMHGLQYPQGRSGYVAHMGGFACPGIGLFAVPRALLVACCHSLHYCCGLWVQCSALLTKGPLRKTS